MNEQIKKEIFQVRDTGQTNMYDVKAVQRIAFEMNCYDLALYLEKSSKEYMQFISTGSTEKKTTEPAVLRSGSVGSDSKRVYYMLMYSSIRGTIFMENDKCDDTHLDQIELLAFRHEIINAIERATNEMGSDRYLMELYDGQDVQIQEKVLSIKPEFVVKERRLWLVSDVRLKERISKREYFKICDYLSKEYTAGWGKAFSEKAILIGDGCEQDSLYINLSVHSMEFVDEQVIWRSHVDDKGIMDTKPISM